MNAIRIPVLSGTRIAHPIDSFSVQLGAHAFRFAVHAGIGFMQPLVVSEYSTGCCIAELRCVCAKDYTREAAMDALKMQRQRLGDQRMAVQMLEAMGRMPCLNTWTETSA